MPGVDPNSESVPAGAREFCTTHWSVVLTARDANSPQAASALETLCRTYWPPLYAYARRQGNQPHDAEDLIQAFIARLLEKNSLGQVDRQKGRFRSFLLASLQHFLSDQRDRARAAKRGGGQTLLSLDAQAAEDGYRLEPVDESSPEKIFERRWALTLLDSARARLREEYRKADKARRFAVLERYLPGEQVDVTYAETAARLGVAEGTVKYDVHCLRKHYRELLRAEIAHTVASPDEVEEEVRHLLAVLCG